MCCIMESQYMVHTRLFIDCRKLHWFLRRNEAVNRGRIDAVIDRCFINHDKRVRRSTEMDTCTKHTADAGKLLKVISATLKLKSMCEGAASEAWSHLKGSASLATWTTYQTVPTVTHLSAQHPAVEHLARSGLPLKITGKWYRMLTACARVSVCVCLIGQLSQ